MSVTAMVAPSFPPRSVGLPSRPVIVGITFDKSISGDEIRVRGGAREGVQRRRRSEADNHRGLLVRQPSGICRPRQSGDTDAEHADSARGVYWVERGNEIEGGKKLSCSRSKKVFKVS